MTDLSPDRPIRIEPTTRHVVVRVDGEVVADSSAPLLLHELGHPEPVWYFPPSDVVLDLLEPTDSSSKCPRKGTASYWSIHARGQVLDDAVWAYVDPIPGAEAIAGHFAFYPDRVEIDASA